MGDWLDAGDRVVYVPENRPGVVVEMAADDMAVVRFDSGGVGRLFRHNLRLVERRRWNPMSQRYE